MEDSSSIIMIPPVGKSRLGKLCRLAVAGLEGSQFGRVVELDAFITAFLKGENLQGGRILVIDEDQERSRLNILKKHGIDPDHHLIMADLGLEDDDELGAKALQLLKDGIEAECVPVGDQVPGIHCPCAFS